MNLPCAVVRDLLPLYAEKMTESQTQKLIDEHLEDCAECRQRLTEIDTCVVSAVESTKPLMALKKEIRKRRQYTAIAAALLVFVIVYTCFYHEGKTALIPWRDGLVEAAGVETRPYEAVYGETSEIAESSDAHEAALDVLVLRVDSLINGMSEFWFWEEDGTRTAVLQGWSSIRNDGNLVDDYNEMLIYPVPDRLLYSDGNRQQFLWGEPMDGGVEILPRLALAYYVVIAAVIALVLGAIWFILRHRCRAWILRQLFLAPVSYLIAHLLIKGTGTESLFMERDFISILLIAAALYALLSIAIQLWQRHGKTAWKPE